MKKKIYSSPEMEIVKIEGQSILSSSNPPLGGEYGGGTVLSSEMNFDDEDY